MEKYLGTLKFLLPIVVSIWAMIRTKQTNEKIVNLKSELSRQNDRKSNLSDRQRAILFIVQNMTGNTIMVKDPSDLESKLKKIMSDEPYKKIFNLKLFINPMIALYNEVSLSTCSEKVMAIRLRLQEILYEDSKEKHYPLVLYSVFYKYLYLDFTGNEIDDFYLLKYSVNDFNENLDDFEAIKKRIYSELITKNNWNNLKN